MSEFDPAYRNFRNRITQWEKDAQKLLRRVRPEDREVVVEKMPIGFDSPEVRDEWLKSLNIKKYSTMDKLVDRASENLFTGSTAQQIIRGAGVGLGVAYTFGGVSKLLTPKRQEMTPGGEMVETPAPSKMGALLQIAAGAGVAAASLFIKGKGSATVSV